MKKLIRKKKNRHYLRDFSNTMLLLLALSFGALALTHAEDDATEAMVKRLVFAFI